MSEPRSGARPWLACQYAEPGGETIWPDLGFAAVNGAREDPNSAQLRGEMPRDPFSLRPVYRLLESAILVIGVISIPAAISAAVMFVVGF